MITARPLSARGLMAKALTAYRLGESGDFSRYAVLGKEPEFTADFTRDYYRTDSSPSDFDTAFDFTRSGLATMVDSDGVLKWAPHNLLTYSEQIDNAAWVKTNTAVTANAVDSPFGGVTADKIESDNATGGYPTGQTGISVSSGASYTQTAYFKAAEKDYVIFHSTEGVAVGVDLSSGSASSALGSPSNITSESAGDGWWKVSFDFIASSSSVAVNVYLSNDGVWANRSNAISVGDGIYIWGAHLYRSDLGGMVNNPFRGDSYVPTTSSAKYLPRLGHHVWDGSQWVNEGLLIESESRTNLITYSEDLTQWTNDGTSDSGQTITATAGSARHRIYEGFSASLNETVYWADIEYINHQYVGLRGERTANHSSGGSQAVFDILNGSVSGVGSDVTDSGIESIGFNVWRCWIVFTPATAGSGNVVVRLAENDIVPTSADANPWTADGTEQIILHRAQVEGGSTPSSYIPTSGSTATRAAETLVAPSSVLPWPDPVVIGDELVTNGTFDTDVSGWSGDNGATLSQSGGNLVVTGGATDYAFAYQSLGVLTSGSVYKVEYELVSRSNASGRVRIGTSGNGFNAEIYNGPVQSSLESYTAYVVGTGSEAFIALVSQTTLDSSEVQWDNISVREISPLAVSIAMEGRITSADNNVTTEFSLLRWFLGGTNYLAIEQRSSNDTLRFLQAESGVFDVVTSSFTDYGLLRPYSVSSRHGSTFINGAVSGTALTANTTPTALPDLSSTDLDVAPTYNGTIKTLRLWGQDVGDEGISEASA